MAGQGFYHNQRVADNVSVYKSHKDNLIERVPQWNTKMKIL